MTEDKHVVALCGSRRADSRTRTALEAVLAAAEAAGARTTLVDLRSYDLPPLDANRPDAGDAAELRRAVGDADAVVLGTPNYHGSYSGVLKNALDYCGRDEFAGTTVGLLTVAGGGFPTPPLEHLRSVCRALNAWTVPLEVAVPDSHATIGEDDVVDPEVADRVRRLGETVVEYAGVERYPQATAETAEPVPGD